MISLKSIFKIKINPFINKIKINVPAASFNCTLIKIDVNGRAKQNSSREKKLIKDQL
ncbi:hypothetical protein [Borreliella garinii]|uniref:hypothetical protein n=1 Tax=Borreliella garinii TaxID=29519 RepID=UPI000406BA26|nr:hypothetical protein [Borreliella garinii]